jgi:hypothetical protein
MHLFTHTYVRFYIEAHLIQVLEAQIASAFELIDFECYQLNQRAGQMRVVPDLLSYMRALFASTESYSKGLAIREKGITKIGKGGSSVLAIGAEEELLPGNLGSTSFKGKGVFSLKSNPSLREMKIETVIIKMELETREILMPLRQVLVATLISMSNMSERERMRFIRTRSEKKRD